MPTTLFWGGTCRFLRQLVGKLWRGSIILPPPPPGPSLLSPLRVVLGSYIPATSFVSSILLISHEPCIFCTDSSIHAPEDSPLLAFPLSPPPPPQHPPATPQSLLHPNPTACMTPDTGCTTLCPSWTIPIVKGCHSGPSRGLTGQCCLTVMFFRSARFPRSNIMSDAGDVKEMPPADNIFLIFGSPGVGKTSILEQLAGRLAAHQNTVVKGFIVKRVKVTHKLHGPAGWDIHSLRGEYVPFARRYETPGLPRVGDMTVDVPSFEKLALPNMEFSEDSTLKTVYLIDGIAEMELQSANFVNALHELFSRQQIVVASVRTPHNYAFRQIVDRLQEYDGVCTFHITLADKRKMADHLYDCISVHLDESEKERRRKSSASVYSVGHPRHHVPLDTDALIALEDAQYEATYVPEAPHVPTLSMKLTGTYREGEGLRATIFVDGIQHASKPREAHLEWFRGERMQHPLLHLTNKNHHFLHDDDIGHVIVAQLQLLSDNGTFIGAPVTAYTPCIKRGIPKVQNLELYGNCKVGERLAVFFDGHDGAVATRWIRVTPNGAQELVAEDDAFESQYTVQPDDLGCCLRVLVTPSVGGEVGRVSEVESDVVTADSYGVKVTVLRGANLRDNKHYVKLLLNTHEGVKLRTTQTLHGSACVWDEELRFNSCDVEEDVLKVQVREVGEPTSYGQVALGGMHLKPGVPYEHWVSVVDGRGDVGAKVFFVARLIASDPHYRDEFDKGEDEAKTGTILLKGIEGKFHMGEPLVAVFFALSPCECRWARVDADGTETDMGTGTARRFTPGPECVDQYMKVTVIEHGPKGAERARDACTSKTVVTIPAPKIVKREIVGDPVEGGKLTAKYETDFFGSSGVTFLEWFRDGEEVPKYAGSSVYCVAEEDIGKKIGYKAFSRNRQGKDSEVVTVTCDRDVQPLIPAVAGVGIQGATCCGDTVRMKYSYAGGVEGDTNYEWLLSPNGTDWQSVKTSSRSSVRMRELKVKVVDAKVKDADFVGKSDPQLALTVGGETQKTSTKEGTLEPEWNEVYTFKCSDPPEIFLRMVDIDADSADDPLGDATVPIDFDLFGELMKGKVKRRVPLLIKRTEEGHVNIELEAQFAGVDEATASERATTYLLSPDMLGMYVRCRVSPARKGGRKGDPISSDALRVRMSPAHRSALIASVLSGAHTIKLHNTPAPFSLLLTHKRVEVFKDTKKDHKETWTENMGAAVQGADERGGHQLQVTMPRSTQLGPTNDATLQAFAFRCFQAMSLPDICTEVCGKDLYNEWRKGHFQKAAKHRAKGKAKGEKLKTEFEGFTKRPAPALIAGNGPMPQGDRSRMERLKGRGNNWYHAYKALTALQHDPDR